MDNKMEHMEIMHFICQQEVDLLQKKLAHFLAESVNIRHLLNDFHGAETNQAKELGSSNFFAAVAFDKYMSQLGAVTNMARKFNIHLQLHRFGKALAADSIAAGNELDIEKAHLFQEFLQWHSTLKSQGLFDVDCCTVSSSAEEDFLKQDDAIEAAAPRIESENARSSNLLASSNPSMRHVRFLNNNEEDMNNLPTTIFLRELTCFQKGYEFSATITYVEDYDQLLFYVNEMDNSDLFELSRMFQVIRYSSSRDIPLTDEVFGISTNNESIMRAILLRCKAPKSKHRVLLIDSGMKVLLRKKYQFFRLPQKYRIVPAQALKCVLLGINDDMDSDHDYLAELLRRNELREVEFRVERNEERILHLRLLVDGSAKKWRALTKNPFLDTSADRNMLKWTDSSEFQNMVPEDLFETNSANTKSEKPVPLDTQKSLTMVAGDIVALTVTHVESVVCFYAQIETAENQQRSPLFWKLDSMRLEQMLLQPPTSQELVLAQYHIDEFWYRARVIEFDEDTNLFTVFYVDYGNKEKVPISRLSKYSYAQAANDEPFRAVRCRLADIGDVTNEDEQRQKLAKQLLLVNILNQKFEVKIVHISEDGELIVRIVDRDFFDVPVILLQLGYVKKI